MNNPMAARLTALALGALLIGACQGTSVADPDPFSEPRLRATLNALTSPAMEGRLAGSEGYERAVQWAAEQFAELGMEPLGSRGFCQPVELEVNEFQTAPQLSIVGSERAMELGRDFVARGFSGSGRITAPVVFVGYGLSEPDLGWDDYAGLDVDGKVVLAFKEAPPWAPAEGTWGAAPLPRPKARTAAAHGAVALLLVSGPGRDHIDVPFGSVVHGPGVQDEHVPQLHVTEAVADQMLAADGVRLSELKERLEASHEPQSRETGTEVSIVVEARYRASQMTCNVVARLRGTDSGPKHVVIGAHLDHVGSQGELLFPGANDNASGVAGVLATAAALAARDEKPVHDVVFVLFAGEEQGLLGAEAYVEAPALPLEDCLAMLNLDCIGEGAAIKLGSGKAYPELWQLARSLDAEHDQLMVEDTWWGGGADAQPFFEAGVPTLYFNLDQGYHHIHRPEDTVDSLNYAVLAATSRLAYLTTAAIADGGYDGEARQPHDEGAGE